MIQFHGLLHMALASWALGYPLEIGKRDSHEVFSSPVNSRAGFCALVDRMLEASSRDASGTRKRKVASGSAGRLMRAAGAPQHMEVWRPELSHDYRAAIAAAPKEGGEWSEHVIFHTLWDDLRTLTEKHIMMLKSAYLTNLQTKGKARSSRTMYLWTYKDWDTNNTLVREAQKYSTIKRFSFDNACNDSPLTLRDERTNRQKALPPDLSSDLARYTILWSYGGLWVDIDTLFLRNFDPLFRSFHDKPWVYAWENEQHPNGAVFFVPRAQHPVMRSFMEFMVKRQKGFGFQQAQLNFDSPVPFTVLPCAWFDAGWIDNPAKLHYLDFFKKSSRQYDDIFFSGAFSFHWHNHWDSDVSDSSPARQIMQHLEARLA
eukprot:TRINITY_DN65169_c0_g1_i1.p1 TRINITY_DN65169_c0_g1~~TRINITY_DN65169_c0_g1_i1.p1  ORF type:complete len:395 (+),score=39.81 TRINITY_DN65169_c0_g1_i1:67-1185(+)